MEHEVTTIAIALKNTRKLNRTRDELKESIGNKAEVITWEEIMPDDVEHMKTDKGSGMILSLVLYMLVSFGIFSTLLMMMAERKFEFGMLLAIGMKKKQLAFVMILESLFVSTVGSFCGLLFSIPLISYLKYNPIRFTGEFAKVYEKYGFEAIFPTSTNPDIFIKQTIIIIVISLLLSCYPVLKILTINPVKNMKR
ncbi:MAG: FtsX-like permease family protein [Chitinophagales bacterium]